MSRPSRPELVRAVLQRYPRTYGEDLGLRSLDTPAPLFRLLVMALLMSARIRASVALDAARALSQQRWNSPKAMAEAPWEDRARVLNESGYARFDERTSTMLGETSELLLDQYRGDLRRLRVEADQDPSAERRLLKQFKGVGDVGVDIFFREAQRSWTELHPFADRRALKAAEQLGIGKDVHDLGRLADGDDLVRLVSGLVRVDLDSAYGDVEEQASGSTS